MSEKTIRAEAEKVCETVEQNQGTNHTKAALDKLYELISCGDKRIELSSAKEILGILGLPEEIETQGTKLEVEIKII